MNQIPLPLSPWGRAWPVSVDKEGCKKENRISILWIIPSQTTPNEILKIFFHFDISKFITNIQLKKKNDMKSVLFLHRSVSQNSEFFHIYLLWQPPWIRLIMRARRHNRVLAPAAHQAGSLSPRGETINMIEATHHTSALCHTPPSSSSPPHGGMLSICLLSSWFLLLRDKVWW